jgi:hypothetical protein
MAHLDIGTISEQMKPRTGKNMFPLPHMDT